MNLFTKIIKWLADHQPVAKRKVREAELAGMEFMQRLHEPGDRFANRQKPIMVARSEQVNLCGPHGNVTSHDIGKYAGRYYLDYRFLYMKDSLSEQAREAIAEEIKQQVLYALTYKKAQSA